MKKLKTKTVLKNIKKIDHAAHLSSRLRSKSAHRTKDQNAPATAEGYAEEKVADSAATTVRKVSQTAAVLSKVSASRQDKVSNERMGNDRKASNPFKRPSSPNSNQAGETLKGKIRTFSGKQAAKLVPSSNPRSGQTSPSPTLANRTFRLKKPHRGRYVLPSIKRSGQPRWSRSHVKARVPQRSPSTPARPDRIKEVARSLSHSYVQRVNRSAAPPAKHAVSCGTRSSVPDSPTIQQPSPSRKTRLRKVERMPKLDMQLTERFESPFKAGKQPSFAAAGKQVQQMLHRRRLVQYARTAKRSMHHADVTTRFTLRIAAMAAKAIALLIKSLFPLLGASSSVLIVLLVIAMTAAVIASPFGLFVSGENTDPQVTSVEQIVRELDAAFVERLEEIEREHGFVDRVEMHYLGSADNTRVDNWSDIMAVFAVKTTMDAADGMDVATLDATRTDLIGALFWGMNRMESDIETVEHTQTTTVVLEDGSTSEETVTATEYILHITVTSKTAEQQAEEYDFSDEQKDLMHEMLSGEFRPLMYALLGKIQTLD